MGGILISTLESQPQLPTLFSGYRPLAPRYLLSLRVRAEKDEHGVGDLLAARLQSEVACID
jgi:hypothetical protein